MSEEQLAALLAKLKDDAGLQEKLKRAENFDAAVGVAKEAGFDVSKEDWLNYHSTQGRSHELSDDELEASGGTENNEPGCNGLGSQRLNYKYFTGFFDKHAMASGDLVC